MFLLFYWSTCTPNVNTALCDGVNVPTVALTLTAATQFATAGVVATVPTVVAAPKVLDAGHGAPVLYKVLAGVESEITTLVTFAVPLLAAVMR